MLFLLFFFIGCILYVILQDYFLTDYGLFSRERLERMMVCDWNGRLYLFYLCERRIPAVILIYIGSRYKEFRHSLIFLFALIQIVYGLMFSECFIRYGMWGAVLSLAIGFPQLICYMLGIGLIQKRNQREYKAYERIARGILYSICMISGILLEAFCNPSVIKALVEKINR